MTPKYAFSITGDLQDFQGSFGTRREARAAALEAIRLQPAPPTAVYVGRLVPANPQTSGHARGVIREMSRRGDASGLGNYLVGLKVEQVADLDRELSATIANWLLTHRLEPKACKVEAVSEYPVPAVPQVKSGPSDEVHDLGEMRTVGDL